MDLSDLAPASIDAIVHASNEDVSLPDPQSPMPAGPNDGPPAKLKGRKRLLHSLQRMSSSPSLARMGRAPSSNYRAGGKASISCVSLASSSSHAYGSSYGSDFSLGFSTAPTSVAGSPGPGTPTTEFLYRPRARTVGRDTPTSVGLPLDLRPSSRMGQCMSGIEMEQDYFSHPVPKRQPKLKRRDNFNFWADMPSELRIEILNYLQPREVVRCSSVSKMWHTMCFDGQLWRDLDTSDFYRDIPADALVKVIASAGPFVRDLNLRGCVQLREFWNTKGIADACRNLEHFNLEGCLIDRTAIHSFLLQNNRLVHVNLSGLAGATNSAMKILATHCPKVEHLNVTWCNNIDTRGLRKVVEGCLNLKDLRAGEVRGFDDESFMLELFKRNTLERLLLTNCDSLTDEALTVLIQGKDGEFDYLNDRIIVPPRKLRHLDITRCRHITDQGVRPLAHNVPFMEGIQLSKCHALTDAALSDVLPTMPNLTHLDLEELENLTNSTLQTLASSPCTKNLSHLSISYCENLGDQGMVPVVQVCAKLTSLDMDNTRVSDLVLIEAANMVRTRSRLAGRGLNASESPAIGLRLVVYDCANVTWSGVREVLSRNVEVSHPTPGSPRETFPREIIQLKCFYNWQPTVEEHTKRVMKGDFAAAARLERKWADWMMASEEAGALGAGGRRRRRRAREAQMMHADEEEGGMAGTGVIGRRRRARSGPGGCAVM
ncbi:F-box/LRR repeat-containing protein 2 [Venturia nashicola]|uniref:F-box/LRR repeat-containing protein 2 n=1 Tax=Venturia nashicola TaxID=86259 RepID=A0A4Z1P6A0_9PEZI|nr:F-box/LRR repeat-containing protein 2 [Venturia nashicola]TLD36950.1 F-box/LRR repeat-containing protein 2 [Venturia nashicola]